jgi:hypothetical protein
MTFNFYALILRPASRARKKLTVDFDDGTQSLDAGVLLLRAAAYMLEIIIAARVLFTTPWLEAGSAATSVGNAPQQRPTIS